MDSRSIMNTLAGRDRGRLAVPVAATPIEGAVMRLNRAV